MSQKYLTKQGLKKIQEEIEYLKTVRRRELAEKLEKSISYGDITENAEFQEAKDEQAFVEGRILELEEILRQAQIMPSASERNQVGIGSTVLVSSGRDKEQFIIVGPAEINPLEGKISVDSPLGKALLDKPKGAEITVETPEGKKKYKIVKIA